MDLRLLRHARALADHGTFARAAQSLGITQPALTRSIQSLEHETGLRVFDRGTGGVTPTEFGAFFLERARELLAMADELEGEIVRSRGLCGGGISIGSGALAAESIVAPAIGGFTRAQPGVSVHVQLGAPLELLGELRQLQLDFLVAEATSFPDRGDLEIVELDRLPFHLIVRPDHPLLHGGPVELADVFAYPTVLPAPLQPRGFAALQHIAPTADHVPAFPTVVCPSYGMIKRIVQESDSVSGAPLLLVAQEVREGRLVPLLTAPWLHTRYAVVRLRSRTPSHGAQALVEAVMAANRLAAEANAALEAELAPGARAAPV